MKLLLTGCLIILISFLTFLPSFNLALFGDDWLAFFRYSMHFAPKSPGEWPNLSYFLTPYGSQDILMGIFRIFFGFEGASFYYLSFILRMLAAFSLYPLVLYLTKTKLPAIFAVAFFSITTTGLETTNWVFNMPTYITIALFNLFLYFFLKSREEKQFKLFYLGGILYYLAYVITPIRMHGSLPFIFLLETFWVIRERNSKTLKKSFVRLSLILGIFLIIRFTGHSQGPPEEISQRLNLGITTMSAMLAAGRFDFIFHPLIIFGSMVIPDVILPSGIKNFISLMAGGIILSITIYLMIIFFKKTAISTSLFIGLIWSILSFFFAWWWVPEAIYPSYYRYLTVSAAGISILFATFIGLGKTFMNQIILTTIFSLILMLHLISTNYYLRLMAGFHSQQITDKIWSSIPYISEVGKKPLIFYFEGNISNYMILYNVVTFGFPPHMQVLYDLTEGDPAPVPMSNWQEVVSAVKDGQSFKAYGYPLKPIPIENVYAFYLQGQDNLINITDLARRKLAEEKQ